MLTLCSNYMDKVGKYWPRKATDLGVGPQVGQAKDVCFHFLKLKDGEPY